MNCCDKEEGEAVCKRKKMVNKSDCKQAIS